MTNTEKSTRRAAIPAARRARPIVLLTLVALVSALALGTLAMTGRVVEAPGWLRERIEARLEKAVPGLAVSFGRVGLRLERTGRVRVILRDVALGTAAGAPVAALSDIEAGLAPLPLLRGRPSLRDAQVSGAFLTLARDSRGRLGLAIGDAFDPGTPVPDLPRLVDALDRLFADPRLAGLDRLEADALTIRYEDRRAGRGWTADGGRLRLTRADGTLDLAGDVALLGGGDRAATIEVNAESAIGSSAVDLGVILDGLPARDIATQSPALAFLEALEAPISGALRTAMDEGGALGPLNATLQIGAGVLQPNPATRAIPFDGARTYFSYAPETDTLSFDEISVQAPEAEIAATGRMRLEGVEAGWPDALSGQLRLSRLRLPESGLLARALSLHRAEMDFRLSLRPFRFTLGRLTVQDPALPLRARGTLLARRDGWQLSFGGSLERTDKAQVLSFWPEALVPRTRNFVRERVLDATLSDIAFALHAEPGRPARRYLDFAFSDAMVRPNDRLPAITGAGGRVVLHEDRLALRMAQGGTDPGTGGRIDLAGSAFTLPDLRQRPATGRIALQARGSLTAALAYIDNPAWRVLERAGRDASMATGRAEVTGTVALPLKKDLGLPDIALDLVGRLRDVESDTLAGGRRLVAPSLALAADNTAVTLAGDATLSGVPVEARWTQPMQGGQGRVTASMRLSPASLDAFGLSLPPGTLSGSGTGRLTLDLQRMGAGFVLESDLAGIGLSLPQVGWRLAEAATGRFRLVGRLGQPVEIESVSLTGPGLEARGTMRLAAGGGLDLLRLDRLRVGDWLDVAARLRGRGAGAAPAVEIAGGTVDLRGAPAGVGGGGAGDPAAGTPLEIALDRLQITDAIALERLRGRFSATSAGLDGRLTGRLGGDAPVQARVAPQGGRTAIRITGEDAGEILEAVGLFGNVRNGTFRLDLAPVAGRAGSFDGDLRVEGARLRDAPAAASLLDAVSVVGLIDQLNGPGIFFQEVEARFRLTPSQVILTRSSAVGPSMGISMDGYYDLATRRMDMQGVLSPVYFLNSVGRVFARKGEGLIGFNFNLRGPARDPEVSVNPLSVFTPGMFRDIFRRAPPEVSQ